MQAITVRDRDAGVGGLSLTDMPYPHAAENDVIVRVHAAGFTVQLAREVGARVTGTGRAADRDTVLGLGADAFLDLQADHLADAGEADVVFDVIRSRPGPPASLRG